MTNYSYGIFIGVNEYLKGRNPAFPAVRQAGTQLYDPVDEAAKRLKNIFSGEMHDA